MNVKIGFGRVVLAWLSALLVTGCSCEDAGTVRKSLEVAQAFKTLYVYPNHRYYFLNQENNPYGVAGLEGAYWINDPDWREVDPQSETFRKVVDLVQAFPAQGGYTEGYTVHDPQGMKIGIWYSSLGAGITVDPKTKRVAITTSTPWSSQ